ncbi:MAG TPA: metallophosphoesterase family protein [Actinomycetota bacterium]|nr:metallophosphoesterase family protein [Actinomycetota bacterium]
MIVAALYDIHGNLPALDAVLEEVRESGADAVLVGGDVAWGPWPRETVERLRELEMPTAFVRGNADREVAHGGADSPSSPVDEITAWCRGRLTEEQRLWLDGLPAAVSLDVDGLGGVLFCHGSPRSDEEVITVLTPEKRLADALEATEEETVVCGHTHMQFVRASGGHRVVNAGSVGLPYDGVPGAFWALLGPDVALRRTAYEVHEAADGMRATPCPHVEENFVAPLMDPPDPADVARHFESLAG